MRKSQLASLENEASSGSVWNDANKAQRLMTRVNTLRSEVRRLLRTMKLLHH